MAQQSVADGPSLHGSPEHRGHQQEVHAGKDVLGEPDVGSLRRQAVEAHVEPDEAGRVDQWAGVASQLAVVQGPVQDALDLL